MKQLEEIQIEVTRTFDAPLELLWQAWTEPEHFMKWYGPQGFTTPTCEIDLREGGKHLWSMQSPDGNQMFFTGVYKEVTPMDRLVYTDASSDSEGNLKSMEEGGVHDEMDVTVTFAHNDGKTTVTVSHVGYGDGAKYAGMGWEQAFDKLSAELA